MDAGRHRRSARFIDRAVPGLRQAVGIGGVLRDRPGRLDRGAGGGSGDRDRSGQLAPGGVVPLAGAGVRGRRHRED